MRCRSAQRQRSKKLYVIVGTTVTGLPLYTRGKFLRAAARETYYFLIPSKRAEFLRQLLQTWNKSHYLRSFTLEPDGLAMISIEKFLMVHYADQHLEVPPLNNSA